MCHFSESYTVAKYNHLILGKDTAAFTGSKHAVPESPLYVKTQPNAEDLENNNTLYLTWKQTI